MVPINIRGRVKEDTAFVTAAWVRAARYCPPHRFVDPDVRDYHVHRGIERLWKDPKVTWLVAAWPEDLQIAYGFLCGEITDAGPVLHWLYCRKHMTLMGIGTALVTEFTKGVDASRGYYTSTTSDFRGVERGMRARGQDWIYDPWLLWEGAWRG
jgi:hypothetical protein